MNHYKSFISIACWLPLDLINFNGFTASPFTHPIRSCLGMFCRNLSLELFLFNCMCIYTFSIKWVEKCMLSENAICFVGLVVHWLNSQYTLNKAIVIFLLNWHFTSKYQVSKFKFLFHEDSQYTRIWKYCAVYKILRCLSKNRLYTKMLRIHLFSIFNH